MTDIYLGAAVALVLVAVTAFLRHRSARIRKGLNTPPCTDEPRHWFFGDAIALTGVEESQHRVTMRWANKYGPIVRLQGIPGMKIILVTAPEALKDLAKLPKSVQLPIYKLFELTTPRKPNILNTPDNDYWRAVRKAVVPAFTSGNMRSYFPDIMSLVYKGADMFGGTAPSAKYDIDLLAQRLTLDIMGLFTFGSDFGAVENKGDEALAIVQQIFKFIQHQSVPANSFAFWSKESRLMKAHAKAFDRLIGEVLDKNTNPPPSSLLAHLQGVIDPDTGKPLTRAQIKSEIALFYVAGFETTAHALGWALMLLASEPRAQARCAAELSRLGLLAEPGNGYKPRSLEWADLPKLDYINAVIQEALRLFPPAAGGTGRIAEKDMKLLGYDIPKGYVLWTPSFAMQRSTRNWPHPDDFLPERWLPEGIPDHLLADANTTNANTANGNAANANGNTVNSAIGHGAAASTTGAVAAAAAVAAKKAAAADGAGGDYGKTGDNDTTMDLDQAPGIQHHKAWIPFSYGSRNCVGMSLALLELRAALTVLLGQYEFELAPELGGRAGVEASAWLHTTIKPGGPGLLMHVKRRAAA